MKVEVAVLGSSSPSLIVLTVSACARKATLNFKIVLFCVLQLNTRHAIMQLHIDNSFRMVRGLRV